MNTTIAIIPEVAIRSEKIKHRVSVTITVPIADLIDHVDLSAVDDSPIPQIPNV